MNLLIIQSRIDSTRLPGKALLEVCGKNVTQHIVDRCLQSKADKVVLAVPQEDINVYRNIIYDCDIFGGSKNDVLDRFYHCAIRYKADNIIRITGDNICIDPKIIDKVLDFHIKDKYEFSTNAFLREYTYPEGYEVSIIKYNILCELYKIVKNKVDKEHVVSFIMENPHLYKIGKYKSKDKIISHLRLTLDNKDDFYVIEKLYNKLFDKNNYFGYNEVKEIYCKYPEIFELNKQYKKDYKYYEKRNY